MVSSESNTGSHSLGKQIVDTLRTAAYRRYFQLVQINYKYELVARRNRTAAGSFRSYELLNRHGNDSMLSSIAEFSEPDSTVYDIGANVGMYALTLASGFPNRTVLAFEPVPQTAAHLRANVRCNNLSDQITVNECGLGAHDDTREFYISSLPELSGFDKQSATRWGATVDDTVTVQMRRLDSIRETAPSPDIMKIDVEGAGPAVLSGGQTLLEEDRPALFIEPHTEALPTDATTKMETLLLDLGYRIEKYESYWQCLPQ